MSLAGVEGFLYIYKMDKCFIIQPFDKGVYDRRYTDTFEPAIRAAGIEPYRVDRDHSVKIPIEQIEACIENAAICFAEISENNPNIWYELGFAVAKGKDVVLVCSENERPGIFPFDIQHRSIIIYKSTSKSDFENLEKQITEKVKALIQKQKTVNKMIASPIKESAGLKHHEVAMLLILMENQFTSADSVAASAIANDMNKAGYNNLALSIAFRELESKKFIESFKEQDDYNSFQYTACKITTSGVSWVIENQDKFDFSYIPKPKPTQQSTSSELSVDDLPF